MENNIVSILDDCLTTSQLLACKHGIKKESSIMNIFNLLVQQYYTTTLDSTTESINENENNESISIKD
jgi:hypothetical protein